LFKDYQAFIGRYNEVILTFGLFNNNNNNNSIFNLFLDRIPPITGSFQKIEVEPSSCGGTLINGYTILTAAHCILTKLNIVWPKEPNTVEVTVPLDANQYSVYLGKIYKYFLIFIYISLLNL
jgi:hypothetical protein